MELVRVTTQANLPVEGRVPGWGDDRIERSRAALARERPMDAELERRQLTAWLSRAVDELGANDPLVRTLLADRTPAAAADAIVRGSRVHDLAAREALLGGGARALEAVSGSRHHGGPGAGLGRCRIPAPPGGPERRDLGGWREAGRGHLRGLWQVSAPGCHVHAADQRRGREGIPHERHRRSVPTSFYGLYGRSAEFDGEFPFSLPERWLQREGQLDLKAPLNFVATPDIIGGNSGSPVINRSGEVVGVVFDGNIEMLPNRFIFTDDVSRSVSVHSVAITEALRRIYDAAHIADELERR
jgi:hypothetical protein